MSSESTPREIIANLPTGVKVTKWEKSGTEYIRVRLGKKFTGGKALSAYFRTRKEALAFIQGNGRKAEKPAVGVIDLKRDAGGVAFALTPSEISEAAAAVKKCREHGFSLTEIVEFGLHYKNPPGGVKTFSEVGDALIKNKRQAGRSKSHIANMESIFRLFSEDFKKKPINLMTRSMIEEWLAEQDDISHNRRVAYARNLHIAFNYAVDRDWIEKNPCRTLERSSKSLGEVEFLRVPQSALLFRVALTEMPDLVAPLAIKTFAGIRTGELVELTWDRVGSKKIEIRGSKSKSRRSRPVTLPDNLIQWLDGRRQAEGPVAGTDSAFTWCDRMSKLAALAGISLPYNCLRHGFGTFHYHLHKNENLTAAEMGNSANVIREWYVAPIVEDEELAAFWEMTPQWLKDRPSEYFELAA